MQQRYYDPGIGRFLSVDPVTANGNTGANFNRYWYASNNPYKFKDPDGRFNCSASISPSECGNITVAKAAADTAAAKLPVSNGERAIVQRAAAFVGKPNDGNKVLIAKNTDATVSGGTETKGGITTIFVNPVEPKADLAATLMHESNHGADQKLEGMPTGKAQEMKGELRAATTEALTYKGMGVASPFLGWTPNGGLNSAAIHAEAAQSTNLWCQGSCPP